QRLGFLAPENALALLDVVEQRQQEGLFNKPTSSATLAQNFAPYLLNIAASPNPDQALSLWIDLAMRLQHISGYGRLLDEHPPLRQKLIDLLGTSEFLGRSIITHPELIELL